ncbi:tyrosine-type recombinase/integrase [Persicimonas caeni]|nr:tyrosine-type recombinase/integrase [Persicimonas caeni]
MTSQIELLDDSKEISVQRRRPEPPTRAERQTNVRTDNALIELWLSQKAQTTQRTYRLDVGQALGFIDRPLHEIKLEHLVEWSGELDDRGYAESTQATKLAALRSLFTFAHRVGYLRFNVGKALRIPRSKETLGERILSEAEVQRILALAEGRDRILLSTLYGIGLRVSEIVGLTWRDLQRHKGAGVAVVYGKGGKTRTIPVPESLWSGLLELRTEAAGADDPVFVSQKGGALSRSQVYRIVRKAASRAGIDTSERSVSPHWLRHSHASHALDRGAPVHLVQQTLGHASLRTTSRYAHARPDESSGDYLAL